MFAVDNEVVAVGYLTKQNSVLYREVFGCFHEDATILVAKEELFVDADIYSFLVAERHLCERLAYAAKAQRIGGDYLSCLNGFGRCGPELFQLVGVRHIVVEGLMLQEVESVAGLFEVGTDDVVRLGGSDTESDECGRNRDVLERAGHRVLAADRGQSEGTLHLECSEECAERFSPRVTVVGHALEVLLVTEAHVAIVGTCGHDFGASLDDRVCRSVVGTPFGDEGVVAEGHDGGGVGEAVRR